MVVVTKKFSELTAAATCDAGDIVAIVQGGVSKRTTAGAVAGTAETSQVTDKGTVSSGTVTFNRSTGGPQQKLTVGGALVIAFAGWPTSGTYADIEIELVNGGAFLVTWPTVNWLIGDGTSSTTFTAMGVTLQAASTNWVIVWTTDGGTTLWGKAA